MSRHTKMKQKIEEEMQYMDEDYSDEEVRDADDFTEDEWEMIFNLSEIANVEKDKAINALKDAQGNFDKALLSLEKENQKTKEKQAKKEKQQQEKAQKARQKIQKQQQKQIQKQTVPQMCLKKSSQNSQQLARKMSQKQDTVLIRRKSSHVVQQYQTDHYNTQYPSLQHSKDFHASKSINIVVVGHVDSGKSTLVGNLLHQMNLLKKNDMHKNEKLSKQMGKASFKYAFVTDEMEEERERGVTIDVGVKRIELDDRQIIFLDSPGHRDFIPNMITGAAQADYAILVIDVTHFDSTFISGGQTVQHAYIVKSLGVSKIIVAVNKMDLVHWRPQPFQQIKSKLNYYLLKIGFKEDCVTYIPISAFQGINVIKPTKQCFQSASVKYGHTLIELLRELPLPVRPVDKPLRVNITNFYQSPVGKIKGHCISGKIEGGMLRKQEKLVILPQNCQCLVKDILVNDQKVKEAVVGDNVQVQIKLIDQTYFQTIKFGNVLSSLKYSIPVSQKFVVEALALDLEVPILRGTQVVIYIGASRSPARIIKINYIFNPNDGTILKKNPKSIKSNDCAQIQIETENKVCVQRFSNFKTFGRVIIREKNSTLCVGTVKLIK